MRLACNVVYELPAVLLAFLIHRKVLQGIESLEDLMAWPHERIYIKEECKKQPLFLQILPQGAGLHVSKPLSAGGVTECIRVAGKAAGLGASQGLLWQSGLLTRGRLVGDDITLYAFRRDVADVITDAVGLDKAQLVLAQEAGSRITVRSLVEMGQLC